ncbi:MAG: SPOR domain-containing protein [Ignavibacteriae bacterium]|nr:SPOR domain-containing protein [Ignavibacteriota bacterium]
MKRILFLMMSVLMCVSAAFSQQPDISGYLQQIESGRGEDVRAELPTLLNQYPNNPGILYVQAVLTTDGAEAVRLYQDIVDKYPTSEWADDALYRVYKFYYAIGLYRTAEIKLNQLRSTYPTSAYLAAATESGAQTTQETVQPTTPPATDTTKDVPTAKPDEPVKTVPAEPTPVQQTPIEQHPPVQQQPDVTAGKFSLQVGVYSTRANANKQKQFFEYQKYQTEVGSKMKGSKELFAVYVGAYASESEAKAAGDAIKRSFNIDYLVVAR